MNELPPPLSTADGLVSYYLLGFDEPVTAVLLVAHTTAAPRGFTLLCQSLGLRLVEAAVPLLTTALSRDGLREDLERASEQARRDTLTGLANRLAWDEAVAKVARRRPAGQRRPARLLLAQADERQLRPPHRRPPAADRRAHRHVVGAGARPRRPHRRRRVRHPARRRRRDGRGFRRRAGRAGRCGRAADRGGQDRRRRRQPRRPVPATSPPPSRKPMRACWPASAQGSRS